MAKSIKVALELDNRQYNNALRQSTTQTKAFGKDTKSIMGGVAGAFAAIGGAAVIKSIVDIGSRFEDLQNSLNVVFGSANRGAQAFERVKDFAKTTQFSVETLTGAFVQLKGAGVEPTDALLSTFANTASVTTDQMGALQAMVDLVTRSTSGGMGLQDLNRLADKGIPVFAILEEKLGKTRLELTEFAKTAEGSKKVLDALSQGLDERFGTALIDSQDNISRLTNNLGDAFDTLATQIFALVDDDLKTGIKALTGVVEGLAGSIEKLNKAGLELGDILKVVGGALLFIFNPIGKVRLAFAGISTALKGLTKGFRNTFVHSGVTKALSTLSGLAERFGSVLLGVLGINYMFSDSAEDTENKVDGMTGAMKRNEEAQAAFEERQLKAKEAVEATKREYEAILKPFADYIALAQKFAGTDYRDEQEKINDRVKQAREVLDKLREAFLATGRATDEYNDFLKENGTSLDAMISELAAAVFAQADFNQALEDGQEELTGYDAFLVRLLEDTKAFSDSQKFATEAMEFLNSALAQGAMTTEEMAFAMEKLYGILGLEIPGVEEFEKLGERIQEAGLSTQDYNLLQEQLQALILKYPELFEEAADATKLLDAAMADSDTIMNNFLDTLGSAQKALSDDLASAFLEGQSAGQAFEDFMGKMIKQVLADILRLQIIQPLLGGLFGMSFGSGGSVTGMDFSKSIFGGGKANGGPVMPGGTYLVGEKGPEYLQMGNAMGSVVPNGGGQQVTYNINAVDSQSFKSMLAKDPEFLFNVTQMGARRLPS